MMILKLLAHIDLNKALHDYWRESSPEAHIAIGSTGLGGWLAGVDWAVIISYAGVIIPIVFGVGVQCWQQVQRARIKVNEERAVSLARVAYQISQLGSPLGTTVVSTIPGRVLVPDARSSA